MSTTQVQINLLPREIGERAKGKRATTVTVALVLLFAALLGGVYVLKLGAVNAAEQERDLAQAEVTRLEADLAQLEEFRALANSLDARNQILAFAMTREVSWARVFNDLSLTFPGSASLRTLTGNLAAESPPPAGTIDPGDTVAEVAFTGYSVERYAPGVEVVLIEFANVRAFFNSYLNTAQDEMIGSTGVTGFTGTVSLNEDSYTRRYADGLPAEVAR